MTQIIRDYSTKYFSTGANATERERILDITTFYISGIWVQKRYIMMLKSQIDLGHKFDSRTAVRSDLVSIFADETGTFDSSYFADLDPNDEDDLRAFGEDVSA